MIWFIPLIAAGIAAAGAIGGSVISAKATAKAQKQTGEKLSAEARRREEIGMEGAGLIEDSLEPALEQMGIARGVLEGRGQAGIQALQNITQDIQQFQEGDLPGMFQQERDVGSSALQRLQEVLLGGDMSQLQIDPAFGFRQEEGEKAIERAAAAAGSFGSGSNLKDFARFNQDLASEEYSNAIARLSGLQQIGSRATQNLANLQSGLFQTRAGLAGQESNAQANLGAGLATLHQNIGQLHQSTAAARASAMNQAAAQPAMLEGIKLAGQAPATMGVGIGNAFQAGGAAIGNLMNMYGAYQNMVPSGLGTTPQTTGRNVGGTDISLTPSSPFV